MARVLNRRHTKTIPTGAVFIGRPSKWGNPFVIGRDGDRQRCIDLYRDWLKTCRMDLIALARRELRDRDLVCWCVPLACHGDVLLEIANGDKENENT